MKPNRFCRQSSVCFLAATCVLALLTPLAPGRALAELSREDWFKLGLGTGKASAVCSLYSVKHLKRDFAELWLRAAIVDHRDAYGAGAAKAMKDYVLSQSPACRDIWPKY